MIKAIIFDLDDTLYSEREYVMSGFACVAKYISKRVNINQSVVFDKIVKLYNTDTINVFNRLIDDTKYNDITVSELIDVYRNHIPTIKMYEDVLPVIREVKGKGYKLGIITDGYVNTQRSKIHQLSLNIYFDEIIVTDELGREFWKPNPKSFEIMKTILGVDFNQMIYIGDNPKKDFYIGSIYPIKTIRINRGGYYNDKEYYQGVKENYGINNLFELYRVLDILNDIEGESNE